MERCRKSDKGSRGCIKPAGHRGRCKVRDDAAAIFAAGADAEAPAPKRRAKARGKAKPRRASGLAAALEDLQATTRKLEDAVRDHTATAGGLAAVLAKRIDSLRGRNAALLKSVVASTRRLRELAAGADGKRE